MAQTYFGSTLRAGSGTLTDTVDGGFVVMTQTTTVTTAAAGTQYVSSTDVFAGGRIALTFTAAQLTAMSDIGSSTSVVVTLDPDGTISTTQAILRLTVVYAQKV